MTDSDGYSQDLVRSGVDEGNLTPAVADVLMLPDVIREAEEAFEASGYVEDADVLIVTLFLDDSGSMQISRLIQPVCDAVNNLIEELKQSDLADNVMLYVRFLNGSKPLNTFVPLDECVLLNADNYRVNGSTPLNRKVRDTLGVVHLKSLQLQGVGTNVKSGTFVLTDGEPDYDDVRFAEQVSVQVQDMKASGDHVVCGMGFSGAQGEEEFTADKETFTSTFRAMGIEEDDIYTGQDTAAIVAALSAFLRKVVLMIGTGTG